MNFDHFQGALQQIENLNTLVKNNQNNPMVGKLMNFIKDKAGWDTPDTNRSNIEKGSKITLMF